MGTSKDTGVKRTLLISTVTAILVSGTLFLVGRLFGSLVVLAASIHWLLLFALMIGARSQIVGARSRVSLPARRVFAALLFLIIVGTGSVLAAGYAFVAPPSYEDFLGLSALMLGVASGSAVLSLVFQGQDSEQLMDSKGLVKLARVGTWLAVIGAASVFASYLQWPDYEVPVGILLVALPALLAIELLFRGLFGFVRRPPKGSAFGTDLFSARILGSAYNPIQSIFNGVEDTFGVDVRSSWALSFLRSVSFSLVLGLCVFTWSLSALVVVDESQSAVRERLGKVKPGEVLNPGLNIGLPWPFDRVHVVDTERIRSMPLGFSGAKANADALWTQYHAAEEYNLLIGDGRDLVTVNVELQYRISDIHSWVYGCQNPDEALETLAYRVLMEATVDRTLDEVLSKDIGGFSTRLQDELQKQADEKGLGIELVALNLRGLHPPVSLATEYQSVIAAQLDRTTYIIDAEAYRLSTLPKAQAEAESMVREATADRLGRLSVAKGESIAFETLQKQYDANPDLYRFRRRLETMETVLADKPFHVIDSRIERDGGAIWFLQ